MTRLLVLPLLAAGEELAGMIPVFVVLIGVLFIIRGLGLGIPYLSPAPIVEMASSAIECH